LWYCKAYVRQKGTQGNTGKATQGNGRSVTVGPLRAEQIRSDKRNRSSRNGLWVTHFKVGDVVKKSEENLKFAASLKLLSSTQNAVKIKFDNG